MVDESRGLKGQGSPTSTKLTLNWFISFMSWPFIVSKFVGSSYTLGIGMDVGIGTKIGVDVEMEVGVLFCKMPKLWPSKNIPTTLQLFGLLQVFPLLHI